MFKWYEPIYKKSKREEKMDKAKKKHDVSLLETVL